MKKLINILLAGFLWGFIGISVKLINNETDNNCINVTYLS